jgi:hypothetical protein
MTNPKIGPFNPQNGLELQPAANGGWVVFAKHTERGIMPEMLGAYSNASDMIGALSEALAPTKGSDNE